MEGNTRLPAMMMMMMIWRDNNIMDCDAARVSDVRMDGSELKPTHSSSSQITAHQMAAFGTSKA